MPQLLAGRLSVNVLVPVDELVMLATTVQLPIVLPTEYEVLLVGLSDGAEVPTYLNII